MSQRWLIQALAAACWQCVVPAEGATLHVPRDHPTIQAAIEAAAAGDTILVAPGTYRESIRLKDGVILKSAGDDAKGELGLKRAETTILDGGGAAAKGPAVVLAEAAVLDGFTITRVGLFDQKEYDRHHATQGEDLPDERGAVGAGQEYPAVAVVGVTAVVRHCIVRDNGRPGIGCSAGANQRNASLITRNVACRNMGGGIGIADGAAPTVSDNRCFHNLRSGIGNRKSSGVIVGNECFDNVRAGIGIREGATPMVRANRCYKNRRAGIGCRMERTAPAIEDNDCYHNAMAGIGSRDGASPLIRGNRCWENALAGIGCRDGARPVIIGNQCYRNREAGIGCQLGARPVISRNECYENDKAGIGQRSGAETILDGNYVHHNKLAGIGFDDCQAGQAVVMHNRVIDNGMVAVGIHSGWKVWLADNTLARQGGLPPLVMVFKGAEAEFRGNTLKGSGVAGIRTEGVVRIISNTFECAELRKGGGPPQFAVWGLPGSDIVFTANQVTGWRHALHAEKAAVHASYNQVAGHWQVGIRVVQPPTPATAIGNVFRGDGGIVIDGARGIVIDNRMEKVEKQ